jgi:hypothetical protein
MIESRVKTILFLNITVKEALLMEKKGVPGLWIVKRAGHPV